MDYSIIFIDDYLTFVNGYLVTNKSEVVKIFKESLEKTISGNANRSSE